jgi:tRNA modification GTPase
MTLWLLAADDASKIKKPELACDLVVLSKIDLAKGPLDVLTAHDLAISSLSDEGISDLVGKIADAAKNAISGPADNLFGRERHRQGLRVVREALAQAREHDTNPLEVRAEDMRIASDALGKIVGKIDVEDILGVIFSEFCVGK